MVFFGWALNVFDDLFHQELCKKLNAITNELIFLKETCIKKANSWNDQDNKHTQKKVEEAANNFDAAYQTFRSRVIKKLN